ncbi:glycoside hydrolase family 43 protein [Herpetosiphon llansteffanensis]
MQRRFQNPIMSGFYPDPAICRVGEDYYLIHSTFEYFPGVPIHHSRDLVHWQQIGHILDRPSQLNLDEIHPSAGIFAPTISHHNGTFYMITTLIAGKERHGNFIVTAQSPAGPWSDPYWLDADGIDPSLFFEDGRAWYVGNRGKAEPDYVGQCELWLQELDLSTMQLIGEQYVLWRGALNGVVWTEGPHLYNIDGWYYLLIAEAGTEYNHAVTIARSRELTIGYEGYRANPILTHRQLGRDYPIMGTGHADLVQTQNGEWWMVLLAMRPYGGEFYNLGRETFLTPVRWEEGWPLISPGTGKVESSYPAPDLPLQRWPVQAACDHFDGAVLGMHWMFLRTPRSEWWSLSERPGWLRMQLRPEQINQMVNPSFVGRRQQHMNFLAQTVLEFQPQQAHEVAGMVLIQNHKYQVQFVINGEQQASVIVCRNGEEETLASLPVSGQRQYLRVVAYGQEYSFFVAEQPDAWQPVLENLDGRFLSTPIAGGFVGTVIGLYASSQGQASQTVADFDWFEYREIAE